MEHLMQFMSRVIVIEKINNSLCLINILPDICNKVTKDFYAGE